MDVEVTEISSLTSDASLTRIHAKSDLPIGHVSRHTKKGFLVDGPLLQDYIPTPPGKKARDSWVHEHGEAITRKKDGKRLWLCRLCYEKKPPLVTTKTAAPTNPAIRHLIKHHGFLGDGTKPSTSLKRKRDNQEELPVSIQRQLNAQSATFDRSDWQDYFLAWAVSDDISLRKTASKRLRRLLLYRNPILKDAIPRSKTTTRKLVITTFKTLKAVVIHSLAAAKSRMTLSFDAWKSDNDLDMLAIIAHYIDEQYNVKNVLLALRNTYGSHTAAEIRHHLLAVVREYRITTKLAFFMADSANNNDAALDLLQNDLDIQPSKQRLRCTCHIINLVAKAILYGCDIDCIEEAINDDTSDLSTASSISHFEAILHGKDELAKLQAWRKKGPIGKLHLVIRHARASPTRRDFFKSKQREAGPDAERLYSLVLDRGIKWNSTCDMLERAFKLKDAIELYQGHFKADKDEPLEDDVITNDDWLELRELLDLLLPLRAVSLTLQSDGKDCNHGSLWQSLPAIDYLMTKLEALKMKHMHLPHTHFKAAINLGWKKLDKYYNLSDYTPAYRAAIVIHPAKKMAWFERKWKDEHPQWIDDAKDAIYSFYSEYKRRHADEALQANQPIKELSDFEQYNLLEDEYSQSDDLERYLGEERAPAGTNPLTWWHYNHHRYPILRHMAMDLLGAPASSSADERTFSKAGEVLDESRYNTLADLAEANQCLKSWSSEELIWRHQDGSYLPNSAVTAKTIHLQTSLDGLDGAPDDPLASSSSPASPYSPNRAPAI